MCRYLAKRRKLGRRSESLAPNPACARKILLTVAPICLYNDGFTTKRAGIYRPFFLVDRFYMVSQLQDWVTDETEVGKWHCRKLLSKP